MGVEGNFIIFDSVAGASPDEKQQLWKIHHKFYVLQFEAHHIGVSEVNDQNIGFDLEPDEKFYDTESFWRKLNSILEEAR